MTSRSYSFCSQRKWASLTFITFEFPPALMGQIPGGGHPESPFMVSTMAIVICLLHLRGRRVENMSFPSWLLLSFEYAYAFTLR